MTDHPYRVIFMGTPDFAVPALEALAKSSDYQVVGVVTQPDRPAGRGKAIQASSVKQAAATLSDAQILQPEKLRDPGVFEHLQAIQPDLIVVAAFGQILRQTVLDLPRYGCINVHASLLPRWRGAAPIQAAIRAGDTESGITIMKMDAGLDTGPVLSQRALPIANDETGQSLHDKLAKVGGELLIETLAPYLRGEITPQPQDDSKHTYAPMLKKEDGLIDWAQSAEAIERQVRAYHPWPGTYTTWNGQILKILPQDTGDLPSVLPAQAAPGEVVLRGPGLVGVGTGDGLYVPYMLQLAGKAAVAVGAFVNGYKAFVGSMLGG
jgi:methionyl-tRNA formyltransferase